MKVLVTGAGGFLGSYVVPALLRRGLEVRALVRDPASLHGAERSDRVDVRIADLTTDELAGVTEGVDVVVHLAAALGGSAEAQLAATVGGTERLLAALDGGTCRSFVLASSCSVYDWARIDGTLHEDSPLASPATLAARDPYSLAKAMQERMVRTWAAATGTNLTVLRPGFIWGRERPLVPAVVRLGRVHLVIGPMTRLPLTHVENCADLVATVAVDARAWGETFNVVDEDGGERLWNVWTAYRRHVGPAAVAVPLPYVATRWLLGRIHALLGDRLELPGLFVPSRFEARLKPVRPSGKRVRTLLGWRPPLDRAARLTRTFGPPEHREPVVLLRDPPGSPVGAEQTRSSRAESP